MTHEELVLIVKTNFKALEKKAILAGIASTPFSFLLVPPLSVITNLVVDKFAQWTVDSAETGAFFAYTNFHVSQQGIDFLRAAEQNYKAQQSGTSDEKLASEKLLQDKLRELVRLAS